MAVQNSLSDSLNAPRGDGSSTESHDVPETAAQAEWPPREWREARRGTGKNDMYKLLGIITAIMLVLVALSFWGVANG